VRAELAWSAEDREIVSYAEKENNLRVNGFDKDHEKNPAGGLYGALIQ